MLVQALFAYGRMPKHPQFTLFLCFVFSFTFCFPFYVINLGCDLAFSYASLPELKKSKMYYRWDIVVESLPKPCCTLRNQSFSLQLTVFNACFNDIFIEFLSPHVL